MRPVAGASDPVPFPELGKADTRSGNGTGSDASDVPACDAVRALDPVPVTERVSAFPSSVTGTGSSARNESLADQRRAFLGPRRELFLEPLRQQRDRREVEKLGEVHHPRVCLVDL